MSSPVEGKSFWRTLLSLSKRVIRGRLLARRVFGGVWNPYPNTAISRC